MPHTHMLTRPRACALIGLLAFTAACGGSRPRPAGPPPGDPLSGVAPARLHARGLALARAGDYIRAEQYLSASIERGYPAERALPVLLRVCVASSRMRAALSHAEPYLERHPSAWSLRYLVASIYLGVGDIERARTSLERVIADAPDQPDAYYLLGVVLRDELGERAQAARRFARYLELAPDGRHAAEVRASLRALRAPVARVGKRTAARSRARQRQQNRPAPQKIPLQRASSRPEAVP
jgi:tetratricopeptide (TPR) repeat protein